MLDKDRIESAKKKYRKVIDHYELKFPANSFISGGSLNWLFRNETFVGYADAGGDIDIFIPILHPNTKNINDSYQYSSYIRLDIDKKLNLICKPNLPAETLVTQHDFYHCVWYYDISEDELWVPTDDLFSKALQESILIPYNEQKVLHSLQHSVRYQLRLRKLTMNRGFTMSQRLKEIAESASLNIF